MAVRYRIVVRGHLSERLGHAFASALTVEAGAGETALTGELRDERQLRGVLDGLDDVGIEVVSVDVVA
jgi:hypothetical protein